MAYRSMIRQYTEPRTLEDFNRCLDLWLRDNFDVCINGGYTRNNADMTVDFSDPSPLPSISIRVLRKDDEMALKEPIIWDRRNAPAHLEWVTEREANMLESLRRGMLSREDLDTIHAGDAAALAERQAATKPAEASNGKRKARKVAAR